MGKTEKNKVRFGLVGRNISYSFSRGYFTEKFENLGLTNHSYENFDIPSIQDFEAICKENPDVKGLNVTIPYKQEVIPFLAKLNSKAKKIGAVNTIKITKNGLKGYNTDIYGFKKSLKPYLKKHHKKALILGTGGASKAVAFVFKELGIAYTFVSRTASDNQLSYEDLTEKIIKKHKLIINCTPLGTYPNIENKPNIPYEYVGEKHLLYDLIYNPEKTAFLQEGEAKGATITNGLKMLQLQAEKAWRIWNS